MSITLFIDSKPTKLLKPQVGRGGNAYFGTTKAGKYGVGSVLVANAVLPKGHEHVFSIGTEADKAIVIPLSKYDTDGKFGGTVQAEFLGEARSITVVVTELPNGDRRVKAQVVRPGGSGSAAPKGADEVFA